MTALRKTRIALTPKAAPFAIRAERASDVVAREALLDACFGENRHMRTCQRLRDGRTPAEGLAFSAMAEGRLVGTLRLWHVSAGGCPALVLGPLAVEANSRKLGVGSALMNHALAAAKARGWTITQILNTHEHEDHTGGNEGLRGATGARKWLRTSRKRATFPLRRAGSAIAVPTRRRSTEWEHV